jgi:hypothetical protein
MIAGGNLCRLYVSMSRFYQFLAVYLAKPFGYLLWPLLRIGFGNFVGDIMGKLKFYVENGTPHPRKIKAMKKLKSI